MKKTSKILMTIIDAIPLPLTIVLIFLKIIGVINLS